MTQERYQPFVTVACIIAARDRYLVVEEFPDGMQRFNQPAGHLEAGESLQQAMARELLEETGLELQPDRLAGIYQYWPAGSELQFVRFTFVVELPEPLPCQPRDPVIHGCHWLTLDEIKARQAQLRSPLVSQCIEDWQANGSIDANFIKPVGLG